ncbi:MAG: redoxin domain-containing protein, partial [Planctomycetia bacterium]|nr:redoxin domain-containing protein [Planctomycetia bacterium]
MAALSILVAGLSIHADESKAPAAAAASPAVTPDRKDGALGRRIPNFVLRDAGGKDVGLADFREKQLLVVVFLSCQCPISNQYLPILNEIHQKYGERGLSVVGINAHAGDTPEKIAAHAKEFQIAFPVLCDGRQAAADIFAAERTCEVFLLDPQRYVQYHGRIDDRYQYTTKRDEPKRHDLTLAIDALLAGEKVAVSSTDVAGCLIAKPRRTAAKGGITYSKQISRIIQEKCQDCHHPNTAAPFSLLTYEDAVNWAAMMKEVILLRRMPPWHADTRFGDFREERRLSQDEIDMVVAWINDGTPQGDSRDLPPALDFPDGWRIGEPDVVFELPREVTIPAKGTVPYLYFETPTNFKEDMYIQAAEARPGNRAVVHHVLLFYKAPGDGRNRLFENWVDGAAPGNIPMQLPEGQGRKIPAGSTLIWQMHYTATGKVETDRSKYAFRFCKTRPEREAKVAPIRNQRFRIPPGEANYRVDSSMTVPKDVLLYSFSPHMHVRGKDFEYRAVYPDGRNEILLSVPQYDFNWQSAYRLKTPKRLPAGTKIECTAHFDNSKWNPANPDPSKQVSWGDQTWQEMMIGYVDYVSAEP